MGKMCLVASNVSGEWGYHCLVVSGDLLSGVFSSQRCNRSLVGSISDGEWRLVVGGLHSTNGVALFDQRCQQSRVGLVALSQSTHSSPGRCSGRWHRIVGI